MNQFYARVETGNSQLVERAAGQGNVEEPIALFDVTKDLIDNSGGRVLRDAGITDNLGFFYKVVKMSNSVQGMQVSLICSSKSQSAWCSISMLQDVVLISSGPCTRFVASTCHSYASLTMTT